MSEERLSSGGVTGGNSLYDWKPSFLPPLYAALPSKLQERHDLVYRFDQSLFALSNNDVRSALLLFGINPAPSDMSTILDRMAGALPPLTWKPSNSVARVSYTRRFFCPPGIVYETEEDDRFTYRTTQEGEEFTKDVAAHLIRYSALHTQPMADVLGKIFSTGSGASRPYINRSATLLALSKGPSYEVKLANTFGLRSTVVGGTFLALRDVGFIEYDFPDMEEKGWAEYERVGDVGQVRHSPTLDRLRRNVIKYFELNPKANNHTLAQAFDRVDDNDISKVLGELVEMGFLRRPWNRSVQQSDARITPKGEEFVEEVLLPILHASAKDASQLRRLRDSRDAIEGSPELAARVIELYRVSRSRQPADLTSTAIIEFIQTAGPMRARELVEEFGGKAEPVFAELAEAGTLVKYRVGRATYYLLPGMPPPDHKCATIIFDYQLPADLLPPTVRSKEEYRADLETKEFWKNLLEDIQKIVPATATDRDFFQFYDSTNPKWQDKDNHKHGKYTKYYEALRKLGVKKPYIFLREYKPKSKDNELVAVVEQVRAAIAKVIILSRPYKSWADYTAELNTETFWSQLLSDVQAAPRGIGMYEFLNGPYASLYRMAEIHLQQGGSLLWNFVPDNNRAWKLRRLIAKTQTIMREKFVLRPHRMEPEDWLRAFNTADFWGIFREDALRFSGNETFRNFLFCFDNNNIDAQRKTTDAGKSYLGKYYRILTTFDSSRHLQMLEFSPELADAPKGLLPAEIVKWYMYKKASGAVKDVLLAKFPDEFVDIDNAIIGVNTRPILYEAVDVTLISPDIAKVVKAIDAIASTTLDQKRALFAYCLWDTALAKATYKKTKGKQLIFDVSEDVLKQIGQILRVNVKEAKHYVDMAINDPRLEETLDRLLED